MPLGVLLGGIFLIGWEGKGQPEGQAGLFNSRFPMDPLFSRWCVNQYHIC